MGSVQDLQQRAMKPGDHRLSMPLAQKPGDIGWQEVVRGNDHIGLAGSFPQAGERCGANHLAVAAVSCRFQRVRERIDRCGKPIRLEIDGGVKADNIAQIAAAGADTFVAGSAIFNAPGAAEHGYADNVGRMTAAVAAIR